MTIRALAGTSAFLLVAAGCSSSGAVTAESVSSQAKVTASTTASSPKTYTLAGMPTVPVMRKGHDFKKVARRPIFLGGRFFNMFGQTKDGYAYGDAAKLSNGGPLTPHNATLVSIRTGKVTYLSDGSTRPEPTQFSGMEAYRDWVVWAETTSDNMSVSDWRMYSYNRRTHQERLIARPPDVGFSPPPLAVGDTMPVVDRGTVYFAAVGPVKDSGELGTSIYSVPIDGSAPMTKLINNASSPSAYAKGHVLTYAKGNKLWQRNLVSGATSRVRGFKISKACGWSASAEGTLVLCRQLPRTTKRSTRYRLTIVRPSGRRTTLPAFGLQPSSLAATSRWAAFNVRDPRSEKRKVYVYDLKKKRLAKLPSSTTFSDISGAGPALAIKIATDGTHLDRMEFLKLL